MVGSETRAFRASTADGSSSASPSSSLSAADSFPFFVSSSLSTSISSSSSRWCLRFVLLPDFRADSSSGLGAGMASVTVVAVVSSLFLLEDLRLRFLESIAVAGAISTANCRAPRRELRISGTVIEIGYLARMDYCSARPRLAVVRGIAMCAGKFFRVESDRNELEEKVGLGSRFCRVVTAFAALRPQHTFPEVY